MNSTRKNFIKSLALGAGTAIGYPLAVSQTQNYSNSESLLSNDVNYGTKHILNVRDFGAQGDGNTDDTNAIQEALTSARDNKLEIVYVPAGIYHISQILIIYENTTLHLDRHAVIIRKADINAMLINGTEDVPGYDGQSNIKVEGGTWDGNSREFPSNVTPLGFGHARNITVQNLTVLDVYNWHHLEINAIDGATIQDCLFDGMILTRDYTEMVQIDLMGAQGMFPWFGEIDNTTCRNVLINRCIFQNGDTAGIGTHSTRNNARHEYITITNCEFVNLKREGIVAQNWQNVTIENNFFKNCKQGILIEARVETDCTDITITNNKMIGLGQTEDSAGIQLQNSNGIQILSEERGSQLRHIYINSNFLSSIGAYGIELDYCDHSVIKSNTVKGCSLSGIWSNYSNDISIFENTLFDNAQDRVNTEKDIRINSEGSQNVTEHHIVSSNNAETCSINSVKNTLVSNNIFKVELEIESGMNDIKEVNNSVDGEFA
jgi:parallel beta-helix repeat protein